MTGGQEQKAAAGQHNAVRREQKTKAAKHNARRREQVTGFLRRGLCQGGIVKIPYDFF
jgi:hypothetical protein